MSDQPELFALYRRDDPHTSKEAAEEVYDKLRALQKMVLAELDRAGPNGLTDWELEERLGYHGSTYRTRRSELVDKGLVVDTGTRRIIQGRNRIVWRVV